jgi:beta-glucosidase-like glycosyl hydrolase
LPEKQDLKVQMSCKLSFNISSLLLILANILLTVFRLAPTVCPHRSPLGGRNFESFSEDPLLAGKLAAQYIHGVQEKGVSATIKHFAVNEQETKRFSMNVNVDERTMRYGKLYTIDL